jgi:hypothetical protein
MKKKVVKKQTKLDKNKELRTHIDKPLVFFWQNTSGQVAIGYFASCFQPMTFKLRL